MAGWMLTTAGSRRIRPARRRGWGRSMRRTMRSPRIWAWIWSGPIPTNDLSAFSGVERPDYERMLADIRAGRIGSVTIWHANRLHRSTEEVNAFIGLARERKVRLFSTTRGGEYNLGKAAGRKQLRDDTSEAEYESEHRGERVALARKRQARNGDYGGGVRPYGWGVDTGRV